MIDTECRALTYGVPILFALGSVLAGVGAFTTNLWVFWPGVVLALGSLAVGMVHR